MKTTIHKKHTMKIFKIIFLFISFSSLSCAFTSKDSKEVAENNISQEVIDFYAENGKGGYLIIKTDTDNNAYFKMRGSNYSNHYFGELTKNNQVITFVAKKAIRINSCKSAKYGDSILGFEFGNDEEALKSLQEFDISYDLGSSETKEVSLEKLQSYFNILSEDEISVNLKSNNAFFKSEEITLNPKTTMLCFSSRIRLNEYKFEFKDDGTIIALNYFGKPQTYTVNN